MNLEYWDNYYKDSKNGKPSLFARFCLRYIKKPDSVIDLGCGIGQDSLFFAQKGFAVTGIDQSKTAIDRCKEHKNGVLSSFKSLSFSDIARLPLRAGCMYLRFVLNAITEEEQGKLLLWIQNHIEKDGKVFIEARSVLDTNVLCDNHTRRFINRSLLESQLENLGFTILYSKENKGFSPLGKEDPILIRIVGIKK